MLRRTPTENMTTLFFYTGTFVQGRAMSIFFYFNTLFLEASRQRLLSYDATWSFKRTTAPSYFWRAVDQGVE